MRAITLIAATAVSLCGVASAQVTLEKKADVGGTVCDKLVWTDAAGAKRTITIVADRDREKFAGGYIPYLSYTADGKLRECKAAAGELGGFGQLVMHGAHARGWATSKQDAASIKCVPILEGPHHAIYRAAMEVQTSKGVVPCTVDYMVRSGRNDFLWAVTFDTHAVSGLMADTRSPYSEFDWEGNGGTGGAISGFGWASANKQFRTLGDTLNAGVAWDWTKDCVIPHVIEWKSKDAGDAEIGMVQTQTYAQHDAGAGWWRQEGKKGSGLPENWNLTYQLNAYQGYASKRATWMMPYGAVGAPQYDVFDYSRKASGKPFQSYALLCVFDKHSDGGVDGAVDEMVTVQTKCKLTATLGAVAQSGPAGAGRDDEAPYAPAGWDHVYAAWTVATAANAAECNLAVADGALANPTFCFTGYTSPEAPKDLALNGAALKAGQDYFASTDTDGKRLWVTFNRKFTGDNSAIAFKGAPNTTFPEISKPTIAPASGWEEESTKVTVSVDVHDPQNNLQTVTIDLSPVGGGEAVAMAGKGNGPYTITFETAKTAAPGVKTLAIRAVNAEKNTARAKARFDVKEIPVEYGPGVLFDFKDGTAQGWTGSNSTVEVSKEQAFGDSKFSLKVLPGQWGANPSHDKLDLSHCKKLKVQLYAVTDKASDPAWPFLHVNGQNTNKLIGPDKKGGVPGGKWVECTVDMKKYPGTTAILIQTYNVKALYLGQVWSDAVPLGKKKPSAAPPEG
jgi:hypothetical protein